MEHAHHVFFKMNIYALGEKQKFTGPNFYSYVPHRYASWIKLDNIHAVLYVHVSMGCVVQRYYKKGLICK